MPGEPLRLAWTAPQGARVGEQLVVALEATAASQLQGLAFTLKFDPVALEVVKVEEGELCRSGGAKPRLTHTVDAARGRLAVGISRTSDASEARGKVVSVTFRALAPSAAARIQLTSMSPRGPADVALPYSVAGPLVLALTP